jgi:hypothetical protein
MFIVVWANVVFAKGSRHAASMNNKKEGFFIRTIVFYEALI